MNLTNRWLVIFLIIPHLNIYYFELGTIKPFILFWQSAIVIIAFLTFKRINIFNILLILYMFIVVFSAGIYSTLTLGMFFSIGIFMAYIKYLTYAMKNFSELIKGLYYLFAAVVFLNFLTMILGGVAFDSKGFPLFLLGGKNSVVITALPTILITYLYTYFFYARVKIVPLLIILISIISVYMSESGTGIVVSLLTLLILFIPKKLFPSLYTYLLVYSGIFFSLVIFRLQEVLFGNFIVNVLHKDITLTGRTHIWDVVEEYIKKSWLLGYGRGNNIVSNHFENLNETHNGILEILMFSGFIGLLFFLAILLLVGKKLATSRKHILSKVLSFSIFGYLIIGLTESVFYKKEFWLLLVLSYGIGGIIMQQNKKLPRPEGNQKIQKRRKNKIA